MGELRKILVATFGVVPTFTGASGRLTELLRGLTPLFSVDALSVKPEGLAHIERYYGARLMRVPMLRRDLASRAQTFERAVRRQVESDDYEIVHVTDPFAGYPVLQRRGQSGHKVVYDAHSLLSLEWQLTASDALEDLRFATRLRRLERHCLLASDLVLTSSEAMRGYLAASGVQSERLRVVPPPVETAELRETPPPPDGDGLRLCYLGAGEPWEGLEPVLRALRLAQDGGLRARLEIAGPLSSAGRRLLRTALPALRLGEFVEASGPVSREKLGELFERSHACLAPFAAPLPTGPIGLGAQKLADCLASGRPVLCADTPLHRELAGADGALFHRPGDAAEIAAALGRLADPALRAALGDRGRRRARQTLDAGLARRALLQAYYGLLDPSVVVAPEVFAVQDRTGLLEGDGPTMTLEGLDALPGDFEPATHPEAAAEPATNVLRLDPEAATALAAPLPLPTPVGPAPVAPPAEPPTSSAAPAPPLPEPPPVPPGNEDWFSSFLPGK